MPNGLQIIKPHETITEFECLCEVDIDKLLIGLERSIHKTNNALAKLQKQPCKYVRKKISGPIKLWNSLFNF